MEQEKRRALAYYLGFIVFVQLVLFIAYWPIDKTKGPAFNYTMTVGGLPFGVFWLLLGMGFLFGVASLWLALRLNALETRKEGNQ